LAAPVQDDVFAAAPPAEDIASEIPESREE